MGDKIALKLSFGKVAGIGLLLGFIFFIFDVAYKQMMFDTSVNLYFQYPFYALGVVGGYSAISAILFMSICFVYSKISKKFKPF